MPPWVTELLNFIKLVVYIVVNVGIEIVGLVVFVAVLLRVFRTHWRDIVSSVRSLF